MADINIVQWILASILVLSSLGVILARHPVFSCLSFLLTLLTLAAFYLQLSAQFIAVMQVLVYAGAILVLFMFVIVLFQDAYQQIADFKAESSRLLLALGGAAFVVTLAFVGWNQLTMTSVKNALPQDFGTVEALGKAL
jgi:NADH-quinone oxidoreductase subunit J